MTYEERQDQISEYMLANDLESMMMLLEVLVHQAYVAGYQGSKGIGLNLTVKERGEQYCREGGLIP